MNRPSPPPFGTRVPLTLEEAERGDQPAEFGPEEWAALRGAVVRYPFHGAPSCYAYGSQLPHRAPVHGCEVPVELEVRRAMDRAVARMAQRVADAVGVRYYGEAPR